MLQYILGKTQKKDILLEVRDWHFDRYQSALMQRNFLLLVALGALLGIAFSVITVSEITKSKSIEPFVIEVNKHSGVTTVVDPLSIKEYSANEAINNYFILRYIRMREAEVVNLQNGTEVRDIVSYLSTKDVRHGFYRNISSSNPDSPLLIYEGAFVDLKVKSVQYLSANSVQVRFALEISRKGSKQRKNKIARIEFEYGALKMPQQAREVNPLGLLITSYRVDDEYYE